MFIMCVIAIFGAVKQGIFLLLCCARNSQAIIDMAKSDASPRCFISREFSVIFKTVLNKMLAIA